MRGLQPLRPRCHGGAVLGLHAVEVAHRIEGLGARCSLLSGDPIVYWTSRKDGALQPAYAGIRPKISGIFS
jgi:hypothetical protein